MNHVPDAPYIQNYMGTGEEYPKPYNRELERLETRLETLQSEQKDVKGFECLPYDRKEEIIDYYDIEIASCKRDIEYQEGKNAQTI